MEEVRGHISDSEWICSHGVLLFSYFFCNRAAFNNKIANRVPVRSKSMGHPVYLPSMFTQ